MSKYEGEMIMKVNPYVDEEYRTEIKRLREENAKLEGFLEDKKMEYYELENLKNNEIAELKSRDCWKSCEYANPKAELIGQHIKDVQQLTKAKEIIKNLLEDTYHFTQHYPIIGNHKKYIYDKLEAEDFLKEIKEIGFCKRYQND